MDGGMGKYVNTAAATGHAYTLLGLPGHRGTVLKAARQADPSTTDLAPQLRWRWVKAHVFRLNRSMDREGGLRTLREELEAENERVRIPSIRCLGGREDIRSSRLVKEIAASPVAFAVAGEATLARGFWAAVTS